MLPKVIESKSQSKSGSRSQSTNIIPEGQNEIDINGTKILFPFEPYQCQISYMEKVIETLEAGSSALLESPTGTGKTLSLLCSILGWREELKTNYSKLKEFEMNGTSLHKRIGIPNIIYSTRTHCQLNQCVQELKVTAYHPKIAILGSREQLCVHPKISKEKGSKQNAKCRSINGPTSSKKCWFKMGSKHMDNMTKSILSSHILDVEDLHLIGKDQGFCPYYHCIDNCREADIIFMPYNYLIDPNIRPPTVNINNSIVIFDEAHNIESVCCDSVSFELRSETLAQCISEVQQVLELNKPNNDCLASKEDLNGLKKILLRFEEVIDEINIPKSSNNNEPSIIHPGKYIFDVLKKADITDDVKDIIIDIAQDVLRELVTPEAEENSSLTMSTTNRNANKYGLETFVKALQTIFAPSFNSDSFKVHLTIKKNNNNYKSKSYFNDVTSSRVLSLWCFNPGIAIKGLKNKVHAMILTSGTLSPLQSFSSELEIKFPIRLENKHLISNKQVYIGVLEKGPCSRYLSSEYNIRITNEYMMELGNTLVNITRRIPYGMLVFFASYSHMDHCTEFWHKNRLGNLSIMEQLEKNKHVISEQRGGGQSAVKLVFEEYSNALKQNGGALLLAVMRGKVSEGMDFSDNFARCVVIAGIPYPYIKDPKINAKRQYMDHQCWKQNNNRNKNKNECVGSVNGQLWYQQQAVRAVNQAIGRVIRHRFDYGCIILADRRFAFNKNQENISSWIRPYIKNIKSFGLLTRDLTQFFKNTKEFDKFMKKPKESRTGNEKFSFIRVRRELQKRTDDKVNNEMNEMLDAQGLINGNDEEKKFKRYARKRKLSDTLGNIQRFMSTPKHTETNNNNNMYKKRKMNIAYELNDYSSKPTIYDNIRNNTKSMDISFHGSTPTASSILKRRMFEKKPSQKTQCTQKENEINKLKARKLRLENARTQHDDNNNDPNIRKKKQSKTLKNVKDLLNKQEYNTFRSVLKLLHTLKSSHDIKQFDEDVVTPFRGLFSITKREHLFNELKGYIPKQFKKYYIEKLIPHHDNDNNDNKDNKDNKDNNDNVIKPKARKKKSNPNIFVSASQRPLQSISSSMGNINRSKCNYSNRSQQKHNSSYHEIDKKRLKKKKEAHYSLDDSFIKLRKLQDENADISQPINRHKRKRRVVTKNNGYDNICKMLMPNDEYGVLQQHIKEWKGLDAKNINFKSNKKRVLQNIVNVFIKSCRDDLKAGHMTNFRSLAAGFNKILTKIEDKKIYHNLIQTADEMKDKLKELREQQQSRP